MFLGMTNLTGYFSTNFIDKMFSVFVISFLLFIAIYAFSAYFLFHYFYRKLFKYFLDNLFRISGSSWMMMLIYCARPFLKGSIHGLLYENNELQLLLLGLVDLIIFMIICLQQILGQNFKSQACFCFVAIYIGSGTILNALLYANIKFNHVPELF